MAVAGEWWERAGDRWRTWLGTRPVRARALLVLELVAVVVVIVARIVVDGLARGVDVWLACALMLVGWLVIAPTKTLRWASVFRLFSLATVWSLVVALLCRHLVAGIGLPIRSAGPSVAIAAVMEEILKLVPLAVIGFFAPGRARRFAAADWTLLGLACGMGFQAAEDFVRQAALRPSLFSLFFERRWRYGWTLFGGRFDAEGVASYAGHHIETGLVAAAIGLAIRLGWRKGRRLVWVLPPALWLLVVADHAAVNATVADRTAFASGRSTVPAFLHTIWSWTGHGFNRGWLLLGILAVVTIADARAQTGEIPSRAALRLLGRSLGAASSALHASQGPLAARAANVVAALAAERRRRELSAPPFPPARPWLSTRTVAGLAAALSVALSVLMARSLATRIGSTLRPTSRIWFAGLLDALGEWWDRMGPGGHSLVIGAGLGLIMLGALVLLPEVVAVAGGVVVTEGGLIVGGGTALGSGAGVAAVTSIVAGTGVLTMAAVGSHPPPGSGTQGSGAPSGRSSRKPPAQWPRVQDPKLQNIVRDLFKGTANPNRVGDGTTMDAIRSELASGSPTAGKMHLQKGREYMKALTNWLARNPNAPAGERGVAQNLLDDLNAALAGKP